MYKFLARGALGPLSGFAWPAPSGDAPGAWVEAEGPLALCARGAHVCRPADLAHWLHDELWEIDAAGEQLEGLDCVVVRRARLVRRFDAWSEGGAARFVRACIAHAAAEAGTAPRGDLQALLADADNALDAGYPAIAAYCAALVMSRLTSDDPEGAYRRERAWQSAWIARELIAA